MTTGKNAIRKAISTFGSSPNPNHTRRRGATATFGMAWDEMRSGRMERENSGQRKIASASGIPTAMLRPNPSRISSVVTKPCDRMRCAFSMSEMATALGGGSRNAGTPRARVAPSHSASTASTTPIGYVMAETRAARSRRVRLRSRLAASSSMPGCDIALAPSSTALMLPQHPAGEEQIEDLPAVAGKFRRIAHGERTRPWQIYRDVAVDPPRPRGHDYDPIGEKHRLRYAVGDEQHTDAPLGADLLQVEVELVARQRVKRSERLVHQQLRRIVDERAAERDPLAHAAGELLPQPLGPTTDRNSPCPAHSETPSSARTGPSLLA